MSAINAGTTSLQVLAGSSAVLLGLLVGGMMAVDMGGPVNKAAYVFVPYVTLAESFLVVVQRYGSRYMAAGMVPPLAVFVATVLFKDKFTQEERDSGLTKHCYGSFPSSQKVPFHLVQLTQREITSQIQSRGSVLTQVPLLVLAGLGN